MKAGPALNSAVRLVFAFSDCALKERFAARVLASHGRWLGGFRTLELRPGGKRGGFEVEVLGAGRAVFASRELVSRVSFNKYALDLAALERALPALEAASAAGKVLLFDELGPMAMKSDKFSGRAVELLFSGGPCLVFFRRGAAVFEEAFARMEDTVIMELDEPGWAEAVGACEGWLDAKVRLMENA